MAISSISVVKRPKVVEESEESDSEEDQPESENEQEVEIKEEVEDDYLDSSNLEGDSFTAYLNEEDSMEIKEEEDWDEADIKDEEGDDLEAESSADENKIKETKKKRTKKVQFAEPEPDSSDSDDMDDDFSEGGSEGEGDFGDDESENEDSEGKKSGGSGLANVMAKILGTKKSEDVILSKAKTDKEVRKTMKLKKEDTFEIVDSSGQIKKEPVMKTEPEEEEEEEDKKPDISQHDREIHRKLWEEKFHKRPSIVEDKDKERRLRVLATQGVVQLFSAIEKHQNMMQVKLSKCRSIMGREKVLEGTGKEAFLDILKQQGKRVKEETEPVLKKVKKEEKGKSIKEEGKEEPLDLQPPEKKKPKWNVLSDNFYKEPTLHGWDQQSDDGDD